METRFKPSSSTLGLFVSKTLSRENLNFCPFSRTGKNQTLDVAFPIVSGGGQTHCVLRISQPGAKLKRVGPILLPGTGTASCPRSPILHLNSLGCTPLPWALAYIQGLPFSLFFSPIKSFLKTLLSGREAINKFQTSLPGNTFAF